MRLSSIPRLSLRGRVILSYALGVGVISLVLAISVFSLSKNYMVDQRTRSAERQAAAHVALVRASLDESNSLVSGVFSELEPPVDTHLFLWRDDRWFSTEPALAASSIPQALIIQVAEGEVGARTTVQTSLGGRPYLATGIRLADGAALYEFAPVVELHATLRVLRLVVAGCAAAATLCGAFMGWQASRRVLAPLHHLAETTAHIAGGDLGRRLHDTGDSDLRTIVVSFNTMVDSLEERIERERRFFGDVSHELRTPLTTLLTSVSVLERHAPELSQRLQGAVALMAAEVDHLRRLLDDLLALARIDAGLERHELESGFLAEILRHTLVTCGHSLDVLTVWHDPPVRVHRTALERVFRNLIRNADSHGRGLRSVSLSREDGSAVIRFDDAGPGVAPHDRARIFERFATRQTPRRAPHGTGTGIGLALVDETVRAHGGSVACVSSPAGGARFEVRMPVEIFMRM